MDEQKELKSDLVHLARLAVNEQLEDVRLFVARLVRKYRATNPELAAQFEAFLRNRQVREGTSVLRRGAAEPFNEQVVPVDEDSRLLLLRVFKEPRPQLPPLLSPDVANTIQQLIRERKEADRLEAVGLVPTKSAIFVGKPGVGKTLTARWLAAELGGPLYVLDLATVMSSYLGKTGSNLRAAIDYAKASRCVLLLDEIDAIAKRRSDDSDVGELKRLVAVMLQEVENWPSTGLLLAATNHPELVDTALWRRFDLVVEFSPPDVEAIRTAIERFLGPSYGRFAQWKEVLALSFRGDSYSEIERTIQRFRRAIALGVATEAGLVIDHISSKSLALERSERIELATLLALNTNLSRRAISERTGVSRDTVRKRAGRPDKATRPI